MSSSQAGVPGNRLNPKTTRLPDVTADANVSDDMLRGNALLVINSATTVTLTIPAGLKSKEPLTVINTGSGLGVVASDGTTVLRSPGGKLNFAQQYSSCVIIPDHNNDDTYWVFGDMSS